MSMSKASPDNSLRILAGISVEAQGQVAIVADGSPAPKSPRKFKIDAYGGGPIRQWWSNEPLVIDLQGMSWPSETIPVFLQHDPSIDGIVGQTSRIAVEGSNLVVDAVKVGTSAADKVLALADDGFRWQASIGADIVRSERLEQGSSAIVNGKQVNGPARIVRASRLREVSVVTLGADDSTSAAIAASAVPKEDSMSMPANAAAQPEGVTVNAAASQPAPAAPPAPPAAPAPAAVLAAGDIDRIVAALEERLAPKQQQAAIRAARPVLGIQASDPNAPAFMDVIEAAACMSGRLPGVEKAYSDRVLEAANKRYRGGLGLAELLIEAARANGYEGRTTFRDESYSRPLLRAAFATHDFGGVLSNIANKFLLNGFTSVDPTWRRIVSTRNVSDFKVVTSYRMTGAFEFEEITGNREFKMATAGAAQYQNSARTYGIASNISREDIINDDLGALTVIPTRIGRGASLKLNKVVWTEFLNNSTFFAAGNNNLSTGAGSAMGVDGLTAAELLFLNQTDDDGAPLAIAGSILLVPPALATRARVLMSSQEIRDTTASTKFPTQNPHTGKWEVLTTPYLSNSTIPGNSTSAYYLLADPATLSTIEVCFLNGVEQPILEQADLDFSQLGIQMRGYFDAGVAKVEPRAGVKSNGA